MKIFLVKVKIFLVKIFLEKIFLALAFQLPTLPCSTYNPQLFSPFVSFIVLDGENIFGENIFGKQYFQHKYFFLILSKSDCPPNNPHLFSAPHISDFWSWVWHNETKEDLRTGRSNVCSFYIYRLFITFVRRYKTPSTLEAAEAVGWRWWRCQN